MFCSSLIVYYRFYYIERYISHRRYRIESQRANIGLDTALRTAVITAIRTDFYGPYVSVRAVLWKAVKIRKNI